MSWPSSRLAVVGVVVGDSARRRARLAFLVALDDALEARQLLALVEVDQRHALRRAAHLADLRSRGCGSARRRSMISMTSSSGRTSAAATTLPLRSRLLDRDHALGAAAVARVFDDRRALAVAVLGGGQHRSASRPRPPASRSRAAPSSSIMPRTPRALRPIGRTSFSSKRTALPPSAEQHHVVLAVGERGADQGVAVVEVDGDDAGRRAVARIRTSGVFLTVPMRGRHEHEVVVGRTP